MITLTSPKSIFAMQFFLLRDNAIFAFKGQNQKTLDHDLMDSVIMLASAKQTWKSLWNLVMLFSLVFIPLVQIFYVSLKGF